MKMTLLDEQLLAKVKKVEITYFMKRFGSRFMGIREIDYL
jgi:hypothetical protein